MSTLRERVRQLEARSAADTPIHRMTEGQIDEEVERLSRKLFHTGCAPTGELDQGALGRAFEAPMSPAHLRGLSDNELDAQISALMLHLKQ